MRKWLTQRQETFCVKYFELGNATEAAIQAGYRPKAARFIASRLLTKDNIRARIQELRQKLEDETIMNVSERQRKLTEIARARITDFMELGQDGSWVNIGEETPQGEAIQEIHSRTEYDKDGSKPTVYTTVKLHDPTKAIDLLNKMDKIYSEGSLVQNNINRTVNVYVVDSETKDLMTRVGERPQVIKGGLCSKSTICSKSQTAVPKVGELP